MTQDQLFTRLQTLEQSVHRLDCASEELVLAFKTLEDFGLHYHQQIESLPPSLAQAKRSSAENAIFPHFDEVGPADFKSRFHSAFAEMVSKILGDGIETASDKYLGFIPGGGVPLSAFGDFVSAFTNRYTGMFHASPGAVQIENDLVRFFIDLFDFPQDGAWGTLTSGGSIANLTGLLAARSSRPRAEWARSTVYLTDQFHSSGPKALKILGFDPDLIRFVPTNSRFQLDTAALRALLAADKKQGLAPWIVLATFGTTNTGSIDPLDELLALRTEFHFWLHLDAAYGGFFKLAPSLKPLFSRVQEVDSLVLDPHKGLFMPYGTGAVLVRSGMVLKEALRTEASYLQDVLDDREKSPSDYSIELTRHFRGPRVYLPLKTHGIAPFRDALEEKRLLTLYLYQALAEIPELEFACEPELTIIAFRLKGRTTEAGDRLTERLHKAILQSGELYLSSTRLGGKFYLRICILCFRTHFKQIDVAVKVIARLAARSTDY